MNKMWKQLWVFLLVLLQWVEITSALKCFFQRCRQKDEDTYICNYYGSVVVECENDEICYEEAYQEGKLIERSCRSHSRIFGQIVNLKEYLKSWTSEEDGQRLVSIKDYALEHRDYFLTDIDLLNNFTNLPVEFEIAENIECYEQKCTSKWTSDGFREICLHPNPGEVIICGSELDWVCYTQKHVLLGAGYNRNCAEIGSLETEELRYQLQAGEKACQIYFHSPKFPQWNICYCADSLCDPYM